MTPPPSQRPERVEAAGLVEADPAVEKTTPEPKAAPDVREALLPCPFCGGEAKRITLTEADGPDNAGGDVIFCTGICGCSTHVEFGRKENLVSLWNGRAALTQPTQQDEGLREAVNGFAERFWSKVDKGATSECWPWLGNQTSRGYGTIRFDARTYRAHRLAWELSNGSTIPPHLDACHSCDNPICVNPSHIWIGTRAQNNWDKKAKGRCGGFARALRSQTHCKRGHPLSGSNLRLKARPNRVERVCRICTYEENKRIRKAGAK